MEKIKLSDNQKKILRLVKGCNYKIIPQSDYEDLNVLEVRGFLKCIKNEAGGYVIVNFSDKGRAYITQNPKLKNPTVWDDKKYLINTTISLIAILISAVALYISIIKK